MISELHIASQNWFQIKYFNKTFYSPYFITRACCLQSVWMTAAVRKNKDRDLSLNNSSFFSFSKTLHWSKDKFPALNPFQLLPKDFVPLLNFNFNATLTFSTFFSQWKQKQTVRVVSPVRSIWIDVYTNPSKCAEHQSSL